MAKDKDDEIKQLKRDYFELTETHREEKEILLRVINTLGLLASEQEDLAEDIRELKGMITPDKELPVKELEIGIREIRDKIMANDSKAESQGDDTDPLHNLGEKVVESCKIIKRIMAVILEDFYPMTQEMNKLAEDIRIDCKGDIEQIELKEPSEDLLNFIQKIKIKISDDFKDISMVFFTLLDQVKDLERSIANEFGGEGPLKEIEYFEMKIDKEVGSITESFNIYNTISEIKDAVVDKLNKIKDLVSLRKKDEIRKTKVARKNISNLKKRILDVEKKAQKMSKKAEQFQKAAMKDGLTGLYSRGAFDLKVKEALKTFENKGDSFSLIIFDIDKFKSINDTLGHIAGDKVLTKVAECLEETFRQDDFIARYGGDEFVVVIENFTEEMTRERISSFNKNLKKRRFVSHKAGEVNLFVSAGTAMAEEGDTLESLIGRADRAMYALKQKKA
ncbi:GGDEF domain-containing protein [Thermodesulfobacteriota bacterium]